MVFAYGQTFYWQHFGMVAPKDPDMKSESDFSIILWLLITGLYLEELLLGKPHPSTV